MAVRGKNYMSVIDVEKMQVAKNIVTENESNMVVFRPDGKVAFVDYSQTGILDVIDVKTREVIARVPGVSKFSPNLMVTEDGQQVWMMHKDVGKATVVNAQTYVVKGVIDTGPGTNHVNMAGPDGGTRFSGTSAGDFAYVTVGGENAVRVYSRQRQLLATIPVGRTRTASGPTATAASSTWTWKMGMRWLASTHAPTPSSPKPAAARPRRSCFTW